ncbi:TRAP transporter small permease [Afifella sp. IM 167]|uniref:TRAP transporter small permease n=1 Tax=Afifella sp. IM 167 TaxID=2033586 RepID=UPI001CCB6471|nr:TRAP transporter small permease [Afifella sp. IM 167]
MGANPGSRLDTSAEAGRADRAIARVNYGLEWMAVFLLGLLVVLVFANAMGRYLFTYPLPWTEEIVLILLVWIGGTGVLLAALRGSLICCDMVTERLGARPARIVAVLASLIGSGVMAYFAWLTFQYIQLFGGDLSPMLGLPKWIAMAGLLFATAGLSVTLIMPVFRR